MKNLALCVSTLLVVTGCSSSKIAAGGTCSVSSQCQAGLLCNSGKCSRLACVTTADCSLNDSCVNSVCTANSKSGGGSSGGAASVAPTLSGLTLNSDNSIQLVGTNLDTVTAATVSGGALSNQALTPSQASATSVTVSAAVTFVGGTTYSFLVSNAAAQSSNALQIVFTPGPASVTPDMIAPSTHRLFLSPTKFTLGSGTAQLDVGAWFSTPNGAYFQAGVDLPPGATPISFTCVATPATSTWQMEVNIVTDLGGSYYPCASDHTIATASHTKTSCDYSGPSSHAGPFQPAAYDPTGTTAQLEYILNVNLPLNTGGQSFMGCFVDYNL